MSDINNSAGSARAKSRTSKHSDCGARRSYYRRRTSVLANPGLPLTEFGIPNGNVRAAAIRKMLIVEIWMLIVSTETLQRES